MSNVSKPTKMKYVNVDTKFRDEYNYLQTSNYNITLPERITDVKTMRVTNIEIPMTFYNISANLGNNCFKVIDKSDPEVPVSYIVTIPDGHYDKTSIIVVTTTDIITNKINDTFDITIDIQNNKCKITSKADLTIEFDVNSSGQNDKYNFKSKLGWLLGFRKLSYDVAGDETPLIPECFIDLMGPRYLYLAIEEFNKGNQNSFVSPLSTSLVNKNVIARITMNRSVYPFGTILPANQYNALLLSDKRNYTGKIDLQKLNVQLLNESGVQMSLNGIDFSFCLEIEHE